MRTIDELAGFWSSYKPLLWSEAAVSAIDVPESARQVLRRVGFPTTIGWTLTFPSPGDRPPRTSKGIVIVGIDDPVPLGIREPTGEVVYLETEAGRQADRFASSGLQEYSDCLASFQEYREHVDSLEGEEEIQKYIDVVEDKFQRTDPAALENPENYWAVVIEQMRDGFL